MDEGWGGLPSCSTALTRAHTHTHAQGASWTSQLHHRLLSDTPTCHHQLPPRDPRKKSCYSNTPREETPVTEAVRGTGEEKPPPESAGPLPPGWHWC